MTELPRIAGYVLHSELGRGGMAVVYAATQSNLDRKVAIKVVAADPTHGDEYVQRLENEARGLAALSHPNIVELYDFGRTEQGAMYYVMPLLPGGDLTRWPKPVAEDRLVPLLDALLDALAHAHAADIIHRDIKPENILFDRQDRPKLADFGAALVRRLSRLTGHGRAIGSAGYMSPEQARGVEIDARSDLYSLAVLAFEMLTGKLPFQGRDSLEVAIAQLEDPVPTLPRPLSRWQTFFDRALAASPQRRHASAQEMRAALRTLSKANPPTPRIRVLARALIVLSVVAVLVVLAVGVARWPPSRPKEQQLVVVRPSIESMLANGALVAPANPNALDSLLQARREGIDPARFVALQGQLLERLGAELQAALADDRLQALPAAWNRWQSTVSALDADDNLTVIDRNGEVEQKLSQLLKRALRDYDPDAAAPALDVLANWKTAPRPLIDLAERVDGLPAIAGRFRDPGGPELVLVRKPEENRAGLAVMSAALQPSAYADLLDKRDRVSSSCVSTSADVQMCIDPTRARNLASALTKRTGQRYRVPTREELAAVIAYVIPAQAHALTSSCNIVKTQPRPNVAKRAWSGVRQLFGKADQPTIITRCDGYVALPLNGHGDDVRVVRDAATDTTIVLVREVDPIAVP